MNRSGQNMPIQTCCQTGIVVHDALPPFSINFDNTGGALTSVYCTCGTLSLCRSQPTCTNINVSYQFADQAIHN